MLYDSFIIAHSEGKCKGMTIDQIRENLHHVDEAIAREEQYCREWMARHEKGAPYPGAEKYMSGLRGRREVLLWELEKAKNIGSPNTGKDTA